MSSVDGPLGSTTFIGSNGISARMLRSRSGEITYSAVLPTYKQPKEKRKIAIDSTFMDVSPVHVCSHSFPMGSLPKSIA